jgi:uncharacterized phage-associated protein
MNINPNKMLSPHQVANYFILSSQNDGTELTPMKLIKLCYLSHGWYLGFNDKPLLSEAVYAWKYGPVIHSLYHDFKKYGNGQITTLFRNSEMVYPLPNEEDTDVRLFLDDIWATYRKFSGGQLSTMTHQPNTPWDIVWNQRGGKNQNNAMIDNDIIKDFYKKKTQQPIS